MKTLLLIFTLFVGLGSHAGQIRNLKTVVEGKISRAGTTHQREYTDETLTELCEQGYTLSIFLYEGARARTVNCSGGRSIRYFSASHYRNIDEVVGRIEAAVDAGGKAIFHCWNGVHATGFIAGAVLNRMCGFTGDQAAQYFEDGVPPGSLPQANINRLSGILSSQPTGTRVLAGCPAAR